MRVLAALVTAALLLVGMGGTSAVATTGFRSATCYVNDGIHGSNGYTSFVVHSYLDSNGLRTWHWHGYSKTVTITAPTTTMTFRDATNSRSGTTFAGTEGYWTGTNGYITWTGRWWRYLSGANRIELRCSVYV